MKNVFLSLGYRLAILLVSGLSLCAKSNGQIITTVAGNGTAGFGGNGGPATAAIINRPLGMTTDGSGNIYFSDDYNNCVRKISASGIITAFAGDTTAGYSGDGGQATAAKFATPDGVAMDRNGNFYIADLNNYVLRKISPAGIINTIAGAGYSGYSGDGGPASAAQFQALNGLALNNIGDIFISDIFNRNIRKIDTAGIVNNFAGSYLYGGCSGDGGAASAALFTNPYYMATDLVGNVYISDEDVIRKVNTSGIITTVVGTCGTPGLSGDGGSATAALVDHPGAITFDAAGNMFIIDAYNSRIRKVSTTGIITTIVGSTAGFSGDGGPASAALLDVSNWGGMIIDVMGNLYFSDMNNYRIRKIACITNPNAGIIKGIDSVCPGSAVSLSNWVTVGTWSSSNSSIATVNPSTGVVTGLSSGLTTISYTVVNSCGVSTSTNYSFKVRSDCPSGVGSLQSVASDFTVYPNPNNGSFTINLSSPITEQTLITITNILGQKVKEFTIGTNKETEVNLNVPSGVYFVAAVVDGERITGKIVVE